MILRLCQIFQSPLGSLLPSEFLIPTKGSLGICISNKPPGQADAAGPGDLTLRTAELDIVVTGLQLPFWWLCSHLRCSGITFFPLTQASVFSPSPLALVLIDKFSVLVTGALTTAFLRE